MIAVSAAVSYSQTAVVTGKNAFLRGTPSATGAVVDTLVADSKVQVIKSEGEWVLVQSNPFVGWLHRNSLKVSGSQKTLTIPRVENASATAKPDSSAKDSSAAKPTTPATTGRTYIRGPRGGCYYVEADGKKAYVAHSLCGE
jgi:uncharacterized protein YgiM (DUF1202 family)